MKSRSVSLEGAFAPTDIVRAAARLTRSDDSVPSHRRTLQGQFRGWMLMDEVHPGLVGSACDMIAVQDAVIAQPVTRLIMVGLLLAGQNGDFQPDGYDAITNRLEHPHLLGFGETRRCVRRLAAGGHCVRVGFMILPAFVEHYAATMAGDDAERLAAMMQRGFQSRCLARSDEMVRLAKGLVESPYQGALGRLYRETMVAQMLFETLTLLRADRKPLSDGAPPHRKHRDAICHARSLLDANLLSPPGTIELARTVGINRNLLQSGFHALLGTTVFGYVRERRLMMARVLIEEDGMGAAEAGYKVGFASPPAFSAAYKRRFGHSPIRQTPSR